MGIPRLVSVYLALVAAAVTAQFPQFVLFPLYAYDSDGEWLGGAANDIWLVLDYFMAAGLILMLVTTWREKKRADHDTSADQRSWLGSAVMFYGTAILTLAFLPKNVRG